MKIIRYISAILAFAIINLCLCISADAAGNSMEINLYSESEIKSGKSFYVFLTIHDDDYIGSLRAGLDYSRSLTLKYVEIENKTENDFLNYNIKEGNVEFIYSLKNEKKKKKTLKFRFDQNSLNDQVYKFSAFFIEAFDIDMNETICRNNDMISVTASPNTVTSDSNSASNKSTTSKESKTKRSSSDSKKERSESTKKQSDNPAENESVSEGADSKNKKIVRQFDYEKYNDELSDNTYIYYIIGIIVILILGVIIAFGYIKRLNKKNPE